MEKIAVYCGTEAVYQDMEMSAKSLYANSDVDEIHLLAETDHWPNQLPDYVKVRNVANQQYFKPDGPNMKSAYSYMAMMRAALAFEFPDVPVILSLDCDIVVEQDCSDLWETQLGDCYFSATPEHHRTSENGFLYTNTGVALYNLDALRKSGKAAEVISVLNRRRYNWVEQDVFNYLCQGYIHEMDGKYNFNYWTTMFRGDVVIRHFAGVKASEWRKGGYAAFWRSMSWEEVEARHNLLVSRRA